MEKQTFLLPQLGVGYMDIFTWGEFIDMYIFDLCTF